MRTATKLSEDVLVRFGVLVCRLGIGEIQDFCDKWAAPVRYQRFATACARFCSAVHGAFGLGASELVGLFEGVGAFKRPEDMDRLLLVCQADAQGQGQADDRAYPQADYLRGLLLAAVGVSSSSVPESGVSGEEFGRNLRALRVQAVREKAQSYAGAPE